VPDALNAHSLYLETLGEVGIAGSVLLGAALAPPLVAGARARRDPLALAALAAYAAWLVHAALDWDWELPAVTLAALACAGAVLVAARSDEDLRPDRKKARAAASSHP